MIRTRIVEAFVNAGGLVDERELGWCLLAEVPVEKRQPREGEPPAQALVVKVNGANCLVIGHSWDINTKTVAADAVLDSNVAHDQLPDAILVLIVQRIEAKPSTIIKAPAAALGRLDAMSGLGKRN